MKSVVLLALFLIISTAHSGIVSHDAETRVINPDESLPREPVCDTGSYSGDCDKIYDPICADNGQTYANECLLCYDMHLAQSHGFTGTFLVVKEEEC